ncbi:MAG: DUF4476 domain-containing protein [Bacteroidota bacterium]
MKKTLLVLTSLFFCAMLNAQVKSNLIFFTEQGEGFQLVLNGIQQNTKAETNVKVTDLPAPNYKVKIIFADASLGQLDKNLMFNQGTESTFCIKKNNKGEYVIRYMNEVPVAQALPPAPNQSLIVFSTTPPPPVVQQTTTTTTTTTGANPNGTSMGLSINDPNMGVNINVNVGGATTTGTSTTTTYSSTTTTTTSGGTVNNNTQPAGGIYVMPGYNGAVGCPWPMGPSDFSEVKNSIESKAFDDSKLTIAKQVISSNCLLCSQVKEIMLLFTFEATRLDLAKYSYGYTYDIGNYYKLNDAFTFESSIDELNTYINGYKR